MGKDAKLFFELILVLVLVGFGLWALKKNPVIAPVDNGQTVDSANNGGNDNITVPTATITYAQALQKYKNARIQLDQDCRAIPNNVTYKNNTNIMIDNRASIARTVKVGSSFSIPAYGFQIVKLISPTLPVTWYMDCGSSKNVATILIQK